MKITATQLRKLINEEVATMMGEKNPQRFLHGFESGHPMDDEGYMIKSRMSDIKEMATVICELLDNDDQLPAWVQDLVASAHTDLEHVKDYLVGDEKMRAHEQNPGAMSAMGESKLQKKKILEGHSRITARELEEWKSGNWMFEAADESTCNECGATIKEDATECSECGGSVY